MDNLLGEYVQNSGRFFPLLAMLVFTFAATRRGSRLFRRLVTALHPLSRTAWAGPLFVFAVSLLLTAPAVWLRVPQPVVHDEFAYLLAADTFASGRLTNPTHPAWPSFETMHVIHTPTYQAKYPPGQGLVLAAGKVVFGRYIAGAWVCGALACAAMTWFFGLVLPKRWAVVGGLIAAAHPLLCGWSQNYWGGHLTLLGGTLVLGGAIVAQRTYSLRSGLVIGVGLALLGLTRPSEGALLALLSIGWFTWRSAGAGRLHVRPWLRVALPASFVAGAAAGWLAYYHHVVVGHWWQMPYLEHIRQYGVAPPYVWQPLRPIPHFYSPQLAELQTGWELFFWQRHQTPASYIVAVLHKLFVIARDYALLGSLLLPMLVAMLACRHGRPARAAMLAWCTFLGVVVLNQTWVQAHYVAPAAALPLLLVTIGLRRLRTLDRPRRTGRLLARTCVMLFLLASLPSYAEGLRSYGWHYDRAELARRLEEQGGDHLVIVRYAPGHDMMREWVANGSDIDGQRVVWARELADDDLNRRLLEHYEGTGRHAWLFEPDKDFFKLVPYRLPGIEPADAPAQSRPAAE